MSTLANLRAMTTAADLVRRRMRLSIVSSLTGVSQRTLRTLWKETHGEGAPNGKLPESVLSFITTPKAAADVAAFINLHLQQWGSVKTIDPEHLLHTVDTGARIGQEINVNAAYYALRDLRAGFISFPKCSGCGAKFVFDVSAGRNADRCPFCAQMPHKD